MTSDPAKTPLRMTAQEFVTCIAVMAGAAKVKERKPKRPRIVDLEEKVPARPNGKPVWKWVPEAPAHCLIAATCRSRSAV